MLRRTAGNPEGPPVRQVGAVTIDPGRRLVLANGVAVPLTPTEFDLLAHLMNRPGRVFTREELLAFGLGVRGPRRHPNGRRPRRPVARQARRRRHDHPDHPRGRLCRRRLSRHVSVHQDPHRPSDPRHLPGRADLGRGHRGRRVPAGPDGGERARPDRVWPTRRRSPPTSSPCGVSPCDPRCSRANSGARRSRST